MPKEQRPATDSPFWLVQQGCGCLVVLFVVLVILMAIASGI